MDELRWFLLILGLLVIAAVYGYSRWQDWRHDGPPWRRRRRETREPFAGERLSDEELRGALDELDDLISDQRHEIRTPASGEGPGSDRGDDTEQPVRRRTIVVDDDLPYEGEAPARESADAGTGASEGVRTEDVEPVVDPEPGRERASERDRPPEPGYQEESGPAARRARGLETGARSAVTAMQNRLRRALYKRGSEGGGEGGGQGAESVEPESLGEEKVIVLTVMAPSGAVFAGEGVIEALEACGLGFGEHRIYHRRLDTRNGPIALYSVANVVEPGTLDPDEMHGATTPGLALFLQLPGPFDGLAAFEQMLQTARSLTDQLDGQLLDGRRCDLTQQSIEHLREELVEYRRRAHLAARKAR